MGEIQQQPIKFEDILKNNAINEAPFDILKDAYVRKDNDVIKISVNRELEENNPINYRTNVVEITNDDSEHDIKLSILPSKNTDENIDYEFAVIKEDENDQNKSFVYTRTRQYRDFQYYAAYASRSDFFDLYNVLRDNISYLPPDGKPRLDITLDEKQLTQAKLQEIMTEIYFQEAYSHPSKWQENDRLYNLMYSLISKFSDLRGKATRLRIEKTPRFKIVFLDDRENTLTEVPDEDWYQKSG
jgi:hypothetical protein